MMKVGARENQLSGLKAGNKEMFGAPLFSVHAVQHVVQPEHSIVWLSCLCDRFSPVSCSLALRWEAFLLESNMQRGAIYQFIDLGTVLSSLQLKMTVMRSCGVSELCSKLIPK